MSVSIYSERLIEPNDRMLTFDLAETKSYFDKIAEFIESEYGDFSLEWKYYNQKSGWILKMFSKKRNVLFIVPCNNYFRVAFTFGDKDPLDTIWRNCIFDFCGVTNFDRRMFQIIVTSDLEQRKTWLSEVESMMDKHFGQNIN